MMSRKPLPFRPAPPLNVLPVLTVVLQCLGGNVVAGVGAMSERVFRQAVQQPEQPGVVSVQRLPNLTMDISRFSSTCAWLSRSTASSSP